MMNRKTILWTVAAFLAGGALAARQNIMEHQPLLTKQQSSEAKPHDVKIFLIAPQQKNAAGKNIACGETTKVVMHKSTFKGDPMQDALNALFAMKPENDGESGLYNPLYQSDLKVQSVNQKDGIVTVKLSGELRLSRECDGPRIKAQLMETIKTASNAKKIVVLVNNKSLDEMLSLR